MWSSNRLIAAELPGGSIAAFPPPHSFFGARESNQVLGDNYYRKDSDTVVRVRNPSGREGRGPGVPPQLRADERAAWHLAADAGVLLRERRNRQRRPSTRRCACTHGDTFKPLPGYQVMGSHYHVGMVARLKESGSLDNRLNDVDVAKAVGINIFGIIDGVRGERHGEEFLAAQAEYYDAAKRQSDSTFLVMPNKENTGIEIGGHHDLMVSKPVYWLLKRDAGPAARRAASEVRQGLQPRRPGGPVRDGQAREPDHQHAASALEGVDGFPGRRQGDALRAGDLRGRRAIAGAWASTARRRGSARYRCLALFDEMTNWYVDREHAAEAHAGDLRGPLRHRRARPAALRRDLRQRPGELPQARCGCRRSTT